MKSRLFTVIFFLLGCVVWCDDAVSTVKTEAQSCAKAVLSNDFDAMARYTHQRILKMAGGKQAMIDALKTGVAQMKANGFTISDVSIGEPSAPKKIGPWLTSVVPNHLTLKTKDGEMHRDSSLLGISEDDGKTWVFLDLGAASKEQMEKLFPELQGKVEIPEKKPPVFKKDGDQ